MRKTNYLQIVTFDLQRAARWATFRLMHRSNHQPLLQEIANFRQQLARAKGHRRPISSTRRTS